MLKFLIVGAEICLWLFKSFVIASPNYNYKIRSEKFVFETKLNRKSN